MCRRLFARFNMNPKQRPTIAASAITVLAWWPRIANAQLDASTTPGAVLHDGGRVEDETNEAPPDGESE